MDEATYTTYAGTVITLNDGGPYRFAPGGYPEGLMGLCFQQIGVEVPANDPAEAFQTHLLQPRDIAMRIWVCGSTTAEVTRLAAQLVAALGADVEAQQRGVFTYTADNGVSLATRCALASVGELEEWIGRYDNYVAGAYGVRAQLPITLRCQSPRFYDPVEDTFSGAFNGATPVDIACPNGGNVSCYPRVTYTGAVTNPKVTDEEGHEFELDLDVAAGGVVPIDFDPLNFTCTHTPSGGTATNVANLQTMASREIVVAAGAAAKLTFVADAGTATIGVALNARYMAHGYEEPGS